MKRLVEALLRARVFKGCGVSYQRRVQRGRHFGALITGRARVIPLSIQIGMLPSFNRWNIV